MNNSPDQNFSEFIQKPHYGYLFAVLSSVGTAFYFIIAKYVLQFGDPIFFGGIALICAGIVQFSWLIITESFFWFRDISRKGWLYSILFTLFSIFAFGSFMVGISLMSASSAGFLSRISTIVILILGIWFLKERFNIKEGLAGLVVLYGVYVVRSNVDIAVAAGFWWIIFSSVIFGIVEITAKIAVKHILPRKMNVIRNNVLGLTLIVIGVMRSSTFSGIPVSVWLGLAAMGIVGPLFARMTYLISLRHLDVSKATLVGQIQPVFVLILSVTILSESPSWQELLGGALIVGGSAGVILFRKRSEKVIK